MALSTSRTLITKTGISTTQVFDMGGINIAGGDFNLGSAIKLGNASGIITATSFSGSGASLTGIANANISASAAIAGSKIAAQFDGQDITGRNINLTHGTPTLGLISNSANPDFMIQNLSGKLIFQDTTNSVNRLVINTDGHIDVAGNLDVGAGIDVTGNSTFVNDIDVDGHTNLDDVSVAGIVTTTQNVGNVGIDIHATGSGRGSQIKLHNDHATSFVGISGDTDGNLLIFNQSNTDIIFATSNNARSRVDSDGHFVPESNNTFDLGSTTLGWRNVYMNDLNLSNMNGDTNDVDGTQGSWTIQEGKDDLYIINRLNGKKFKIKMEEIS